MIDQLATLLTEHPNEIVMWTHGFGWALALRRARISALLDRALPDTDSDTDGDSNEDSQDEPDDGPTEGA